MCLITGTVSFTDSTVYSESIGCILFKDRFRHINISSIDFTLVPFNLSYHLKVSDNIVSNDSGVNQISSHINTEYVHLQAAHILVA